MRYHTLRRHWQQLVLLLGLMLVLTPHARAGGLDAQLDRSRIGEGETVTLLLSGPGGQDASPDLSPLAQDFDILNRGQSSRMQIVNGRVSSSHEWQFTLAPKRSGTLQIPSLSIGALRSEPLQLQVLPAAQVAASGDAPPVALEVEASPENPYVQGEVVYRVRLLSRVPLQQASLGEPDADNAVVQRLGEDRQYDTQRDGRRYRVVERRYAIFPQHSGKLTVQAPLLSAQVPEQANRGRRFNGRDAFSDFDRLFGNSPFANDPFFARTRPLHLRGREITLEVQPQPAGTAQPWLPARSLDLSETWAPDPPVFRVGEPVTRIVAITAQGLTSAQLPDLAIGEAAGITAYPDKGQVQTRVDGDALMAQKVLKAALVPTRAGHVQLPEITLAWWDLDAGRQRVARIPARDIEVLPAAAGSAVPVPSPPAQPVAEPRQQAATPAHAPAASTAGGEVTATGGAGYWPWIAALLALGWVVSVGLWWWQRQRAATPMTQSRVSVAPGPQPGKALRHVQQACRDNDAAVARRALLEWAEAQWPEDPPTNLDRLARRLAPDGAGVLAELDRSLYSGAAAAWDGRRAWETLGTALAASARPSTGARGPASALPPLYPGHG